MAEPDPARLAAIDQQLAAISDRLERHARFAMRGDAALAVLALAGVVYAPIARPSVGPRDVALLFAIVALLAAGSYLQGRMLLSCRDEIRDLRSRR